MVNKSFDNIALVSDYYEKNYVVKLNFVKCNIYCQINLFFEITTINVNANQIEFHDFMQSSKTSEEEYEKVLNHIMPTLIF